VSHGFQLISAELDLPEIRSRPRSAYLGSAGGSFSKTGDSRFEPWLPRSDSVCWSRKSRLLCGIYRCSVTSSSSPLFREFSFAERLVSVDYPLREPRDVPDAVGSTAANGRAAAALATGLKLLAAVLAPPSRAHPEDLLPRLIHSDREGASSGLARPNWPNRTAFEPCQGTRGHNAEQGSWHRSRLGWAGDLVSGPSS
jgi:hypothetical protein